MYCFFSFLVRYRLNESKPVPCQKFGANCAGSTYLALGSLYSIMKHIDCESSCHSLFFCYMWQFMFPRAQMLANVHKFISGMPIRYAKTGEVLITC